MYYSIVSPRKTSILLLFIPSIILNVSSFPFFRRSNPGCGNIDDEAVFSDGPTSDKTAGMGVEFETLSLLFLPTGCTQDQINQLKGKMIDGRQGTNWKFTGDTTFENALSAEYILDGTQIKINTNAAGSVAAAVAADLISWDPWADPQNSAVTVEGSPQGCTWAISQPDKKGGAASFSWAPQITAPMPLEAINDLFIKAVAKNPSALLKSPGNNPGLGMISGTKDFFQTAPGKITAESAENDVLGFFSLVMSYAKSAAAAAFDESPKQKFSIMPRSDFITLYNQVKSAVNPPLYDIVKILACYDTNPSGPSTIDKTYCDGTPDSPQPNGNFDKIKFTFFDESNPDQTDPDAFTIQQWMESIEKGVSPDLLTKFDQKFDGSIGGLGTALENVLDTTRAVPLFEFRNLPGASATNFQSIVENAEQEIIKYHQEGTNPLRLLKRQAAASACSTTITSATPLCSLQNEDPDQGINTRACICGSTTLPLLTMASATVDTQSCMYMSIPSASAPSTTPPTTTMSASALQYPDTTTLINGEIIECATLTTSDVAGFAATLCAGSSAILKTASTAPFFSVQVGQSAVNVGTLAPTALYTSISSALEKICPTQSGNAPGACSTNTVAIQGIDIVEGPAGGDPKEDFKTGQLVVSVPASSYANTQLRDSMIKAAANTAASGANKTSSCADHQVNSCVTLDCDEPDTDFHICSTGSFAGVQYYNGQQVGAQGYLDAEWKFDLTSGGLFDCAGTLDEINEALNVILPELVVEDAAVIQSIVVACEAVFGLLGG